MLSPHFHHWFCHCVETLLFIFLWSFSVHRFHFIFLFTCSPHLPFSLIICFYLCFTFLTSCFLTVWHSCWLPNYIASHTPLTQIRTLTHFLFFVFLFYQCRETPMWIRLLITTHKIFFCTIKNKTKKKKLINKNDWCGWKSVCVYIIYVSVSYFMFIPANYCVSLLLNFLQQSELLKKQ